MENESTKKVAEKSRSHQRQNANSTPTSKAPATSTPTSKQPQTPSLNTSNIQGNGIPNSPSTAFISKLPPRVMEPARASGRPTPPSRAIKGAKPAPRPPSIQKATNPAVTQQPSPRPGSSLVPQFHAKATPVIPSAAASGELNRFAIIDKIEELIKKYDPVDLKTFYDRKKDFLARTPVELEKLHSQLLIRYMTQKSQATTPAGGIKRPSDSSSNNGPSVAAKIRKTIRTPSTSHSSSTSTTAVPPVSSTPSSSRAQDFQYLTQQVKQAIPTTTARRSPDDEIMIIGEKIKKTPSSSNTKMEFSPSSSKLSYAINTVASRTVLNDNSSTAKSKATPSSSLPQKQTQASNPRSQPNATQSSTSISQQNPFNLPPRTSGASLHSNNNSSASSNNSTPKRPPVPQQPATSTSLAAMNQAAAANPLLLQQMQLLQNAGANWTSDQTRQFFQTFLTMNALNQKK